MEYQLYRAWPRERADAYQIVTQLAPNIVIQPLTSPPKTIAAVDTDYGVGGTTLYAGAVAMTYPACEEIERAFFHGSPSFPYIPGLFFFREGPIIVEALAKLATRVDAIVVNGHGLAHPRGCGLACHIGYIFKTPSIGCARKLLAGSHDPLGEPRGSRQPLVLEGRSVGLVYRSKENVKPIYISAGHLCDLDSARAVIEGCLREFRLPEPLRIAHLLANRYRQRMEREGSPHTRDVENE